MFLKNSNNEISSADEIIQPCYNYNSRRKSICRRISSPNVSSEQCSKFVLSNTAQNEYRRHRNRDCKSTPIINSSFLSMHRMNLTTSCYFIIGAFLSLSIFQSNVFVMGFPTYLLSRSQCWTQLAVGEIIMNHAVVSAEESDDPEMHIRAFTPSDGTDPTKLPHHIDKTTVVVPGGFPSIISVHVITTNTKTHPDFQWAMDVKVPLPANVKDEPPKPRAHFVDGSCNNRVRISGRGDEVVSVTVEEEGAQLVAAWANGVEAVRLTPLLTFVGPNGARTGVIPPEKKKDTIQQQHNEEEKYSGRNEESVKDIRPDMRLHKKAEDPQKVVDNNILSRFSAGAIHEQIVRHRERLIKEREEKKRDENGGVGGQEEAPPSSRSGPRSRGDGTKHRKVAYKKIKNDHRDTPPTTDDQYLKRQTFSDQEERIKEFLLQDKHSNAEGKNILQHQHHHYHKPDEERRQFRIEFRNLFRSKPTQPNGSGFGITYSSYLTGCGVLLISTFVAIHTCIWASKRTPSSSSSIKGRRSL